MNFSEILELLNTFNQIALQAMVITRSGVFKYTNHDGIIIYHMVDNKHYRYFL